MIILHNNINFGTNCRKYTNQDGKTIGTHSWPFREDLEWENFAKYQADHFHNKDKINVVQFAASDGSEAYTYIMSLLDKKIGDKFFPIKAYDIDSEILKAARSKLLKFNSVDIRSLKEKTDNFSDYFENTESEIKIENDSELSTQKTYRAKEVLTSRVNFKLGDMFEIIKKLKDDSNTTLLCRNILFYFNAETIKNFIQTVSQKLKAGSLFVIGGKDAKCKKLDIERTLLQNNFTKVMQNVYKKTLL